MMLGNYGLIYHLQSLQLTEAVIDRYIDPCGLFLRLGCSPFLWHPMIATTLAACGAVSGWDCDASGRHDDH